MATTSPLILASPTDIAGVWDKTLPIVGAPTFDVGYTVAFPRNPSTLTNTSKVTFPTRGAQYQRFELEVAANPVANHADIIARHVTRYQQITPGISARDVADYRAQLQAFVTAYAAYLA